jgi:sigma-E factor negative regulatory protein RseC
MLKETGRVVAIEADSLWVETIRQSTCGSCSAQKACGHGLMNKVASGKACHLRVPLSVEQRGQYALGDQVELAIPEHVLVKSALLVYLLPLLLMLLGAALPSLWVSADSWAVLGAFAGLAAGFYLLRLYDVFTRNDPQSQPVLLTPVPQVIDLSHVGRSSPI